MAIALAVAFSARASREADAGMHRVTWRGAEGSLWQGSLPAAEWENFQTTRRELAERDVALLRGFAAHALDQELTPIFTAMDRRVADFGEWAFRWRTSYALLRRQAGVVLKHPFADGDKGLVAALRATDEAFVRDKFDELVLQAEAADRDLREARARWLTRLDAALAGIQADHRLAMQMFLERQARDIGRPVEDQPAPIETPETLEQTAGLEQPAKLDTGATDAALSPLVIRSARPLMSRAAVRLPAILPFAAVSEAVNGVTGLSLAGGAASTAMAIAATLSFDFVVSCLDESSSRTDFEALIGQSLAASRHDLARAWLTPLDPIIRTRLTGMAGGDGGN